MFDSAKESRSTITERKRGLHWAGVVNGQLAIDMANNLENLFQEDPSQLQMGPDTNRKPRGKAKGKGKALPDGARGTKRGRAIPTQEDHVQLWAKTCMAYTMTLKESKGHIASKPWAGELTKKLDDASMQFEKLHEKFAGLKDFSLLQDYVNEFDKIEEEALEYIKGSDSMLGVKKRKTVKRPPPFDQAANA